jgi:hypothetical protein
MKLSTGKDGPTSTQPTATTNRSSTTAASTNVVNKEREQRLARQIAAWESTYQLHDNQTTMLVKMSSMFKERKIPEKVSANVPDT